MQRHQAFTEISHFQNEYSKQTPCFCERSLQNGHSASEQLCSCMTHLPHAIQFFVSDECLSAQSPLYPGGCCCLEKSFMGSVAAFVCTFFCKDSQEDAARTHQPRGEASSDTRKDESAAGWQGYHPNAPARLIIHSIITKLF